MRICATKREDAKALFASLYAESLSPANMGKTKIVVRISDREPCVDVHLLTDTLTHLRAIVNSLIYLSSAALKTLEVLSSAKA